MITPRDGQTYVIMAPWHLYRSQSFLACLTLYGYPERGLNSVLHQQTTGRFRHVQSLDRSDLRTVQELARTPK
jgi:hypothetical protein